MKTVNTIYKGDLRTEAIHNKSGTKITTDAPTDNQGKGESFSPTDLLATALGSCMLTIMGISARTHNFNINGTTIETTKIMGQNPRRVVGIVVEFTFPHSNYTAKEIKVLELAAKECPVANSLHPDLEQTITFKFNK